jgi:hypothetical protein
VEGINNASGGQIRIPALGIISVLCAQTKHFCVDELCSGNYLSIDQGEFSHEHFRNSKSQGAV